MSYEKSMKAQCRTLLLNTKFERYGILHPLGMLQKVVELIGKSVHGEVLASLFI